MRNPPYRSSENPVLLYWMLGIWVVLNLFQASLTGLIDDEALYWLHGLKFDWGYFEQAPMAAYLIRAGYALLPSELGVRLGSLFLSTFTIYLVGRIAGVKNFLLFGVLVFAVFIIHAGGFIATPDVPAVFFVVLFFLAYQQFIKKPTILVAIFWGLTMAGIICSKYNAVLIILFTLLSNRTLLKTRAFYLAVGSGILFLLPHLIWLIRHDYQTIDFILFERSYTKDNHLVAVKDYLLAVLLIFGPLVSLILVWFTIARKPRDLFERGLKFSALGILLFFLLYTFRGRVEGNWAAPAVIPMLILTYRSLEDKKNLHRFIYILTMSSLVIILTIRIFVVYNFIRLPKHVPNFTGLSSWNTWATEIKDHANGCPVAFFNSYQKASKYIFYTHLPALSLDSYRYHKTLFFHRKNIEQDIQGKRVCLVTLSSSSSLPGKNCFEGEIYPNTCYTFVDNFRSYYRIPLELYIQNEPIKRDSSFPVTVRIMNPDPEPLRFDQNPAFPSFLVYHFKKDGMFVMDEERALEITRMVIPGAYADTLITVRTPQLPGRYLFTVSIETGWLPPAKNTRYRTVIIH